MNVSIKYPHQLTKGDIVYLNGLNVTEKDSEVGGYLELVHERVYQGLIHHENLKAQRMRVPQEMARDLGQKQLETENEDSKEALYYCCLYGMYGYDKYGLFDFEIVSNSLDAGRDMQI